MVPESAASGTVDLSHEHKTGSQPAAPVAGRAAQEPQAAGEASPEQVEMGRSLQGQVYKATPEPDLPDQSLTKSTNSTVQPQFGAKSPG